MMRIGDKLFEVNGLSFTIRSAIQSDANTLSRLRTRIDGETENLDREKGETLIGCRRF
jgi:hypothetical protein